MEISESSFRRRVVLPAIYAARGEPVLRELSLLEATQWLDRKQLEALQARKLRDLLEYCFQHVPFYRSRLPTPRSGWRDVDPREYLAGIPILEKSDVRRLALERSCSIGRFERHTVRRTAGTSGEPLVVFADPLTNARSLAARARSLAWFGVQMGDRECRLWGRAPRGLERTVASAKDLLLNRFRLSTAELEPDRMALTVRRAIGKRPDYLYGYGAMLCEFGEALAKVAGSGELGLKVAVLTSEAAGRSRKEQLARLLGCPVVDEYGCSEVDIVAHQCPEQNYHLIAENVLVEILPADPADPARGQIVVTDLNNRLMPLVRYRIGDDIVAREGHCACGRTLPMIAAVAGRTAYQYFHLPGGRRVHSYVFEYFIDDLLAAGLGVKQFQVQQKTEEHVVLLLVLDRDVTENRQAVLVRVRARLQREVGDDVSIELRFLDRIIPLPGQKHECFMPMVSGPVPG